MVSPCAKANFPGNPISVLCHKSLVQQMQHSMRVCLFPTAASVRLLLTESMLHCLTVGTTLLVDGWGCVLCPARCVCFLLANGRSCVYNSSHSATVAAATCVKTRSPPCMEPSCEDRRLPSLSIRRSHRCPQRMAPATLLRLPGGWGQKCARNLCALPLRRRTHLVFSLR